MKFRLFFIFIFVAQFGCNKVGEDDPKISFRSRDKRLIGKWEITQLYYYDGNLSGLNNLGDPQHYIFEINMDGRYYFWDSIQSKRNLIGNWWWASADQDYKKKERIVLNSNKSPWIEVHILEELRFKEMRTREYFDLSDFKRYNVYTWKRLN